MDKYVYNGPVCGVGGICICNQWRGETSAVSKEKAKCNLAYQFKKQSNLVASAKITLPGEVARI